MRHARSQTRTRRRRLGSAVALLATVLLAVALATLPVNGAGAAPTAWTTYSTSWTNGVVLCSFDATAPVVTVSSPTMNDTGLWASLGEIQEVGPGGIVASAELSQGSWVASNLSTDDWFELSYSGQVPIVAVGASSASGSVDLQVDFILPAYSGATPGPTNEVTLAVHLTNWSWQNSHDSMDLLLPFAAAFPGGEHLAVGGPAGALLTGVSNASGDSLQYLSASQQAVASTPGGAPTNLSVTPSLVVLPESATVTIAFGTQAGAFPSLNYTTAIGIVLPATVAGIPILDFAVVGSVAVVASLAIAVGVRTVRGRPSDLEYAKEEE
ncbi:MAG: hypothetical protein WB809_08615 [Thermoplasmata archaeon]